jgi:hypothetical protein
MRLHVAQTGDRFMNLVCGRARRFRETIPHMIHLPIEIRNLYTESLLVGDARFKSIEIESNEACARSGESVRESDKQSDPLLDKFQN